MNAVLRALSVAALAAVPASPSLGAPVPFRRAAPQTPEQRAEFRTAFEKALGIGAKAELARLVGREVDLAAEWIVEISEKIAGNPDERAFHLIGALREAWEASVETDFCAKMERYYSLVDGPTKRERLKFKKEYDKKSAEFQVAEEPPQYTKLGIEFESLARAFQEVGDVYYESQCWAFTANAFDETLAKQAADLKRSCKAFALFLETRESLGLDDKWYKIAKPRYQKLVALGYGPDPKPGEPGEPGAGAAAQPAAPPVEAALTFELIGDVTAIERPSYYMDELYPAWNVVALLQKGSRTALPRIEQFGEASGVPTRSPDFLRVGAADVQVDVDLDGEGDVEVPLRGRVEPLVFEIGEGEAKRRWGVLVTTGVQKDTYQNLEFNLQPDDDQMMLYIAAAASMKGDLNGTPIQIIDDNMDGVYGNLPTTWGHLGLTENQFQPELDSVVIGGSKRALPWSEYQKIEGQWYKLESLNGGTRIRATPAAVRTGALNLKYKGPDLAFLVVKGANDYENSFFDLTTEKTVEVPVGRYTLYGGMVSKGKKRQVLKAFVLPSDSTPAWDVLNEGEEVEVELGAPFTFDFDVTVDDSMLTVHGQSISVLGVANERYERIWGAVPRPEVSYRRAGTSRGSKPEDMPMVMDQNQISELGWGSAWFPLDLGLEKDADETEIEVQLVEKKNKLFGKIESDWTTVQ